MYRQITLLASVLVLAGSASGCWFFAEDSCRLEPVGELPVAAISAPLPRIGAPYATGACSSWVTYNGHQYTDTGYARSWRDAFTITEEDLTPIGHAESATVQAGPFADDTVYSIRGVDRDDAVAMHYATGVAPIAVLLAPYVPPPELCGYFKEPMDAQAGSMCSP